MDGLYLVRNVRNLKVIVKDTRAIFRVQLYYTV